MIRPASDMQDFLQWNIKQRDNARGLTDASEETSGLLFERKPEFAEALEENEKRGGLTDAQRQMVNNAKTLAMASMMVEDDEEEEDAEKTGWGQEKRHTEKAGKSGGENEAAKVSFESKDGKSSGGSSGSGSSSETEVVERPDGSKVMIIRTEISPGVYTTVKVQIAAGTAKRDDDAAVTQGAGTPTGATSPDTVQ